MHRHREPILVQDLCLTLKVAIFQLQGSSNHLGHAEDSEIECAQSDAALYRRLCPADKAGKMSFAPVMLKRLHKLGIDKTDPADLTEEERSRSVCADYRFIGSNIHQRTLSAVPVASVVLVRSQKRMSQK